MKTTKEELRSEIREVYYDSFCEDGDPQILSKRNLHWQSKSYFTVQDVIFAMNGILYNDFDVNILEKLAQSFPKTKCKPAREGSVCIYIETPTKNVKQLMAWLQANSLANEIDKEDKQIRLWWD